MTSHGAVPDDAIHPLRRLDVARDDLAERTRLYDLLRDENVALEHACRLHQRLLDALTREELDVERLEGVSAARVWSAIRGSRQQDLDRERSEAGAKGRARRGYH